MMWRFKKALFDEQQKRLETFYLTSKKIVPDDLLYQGFFLRSRANAPLKIQVLAMNSPIFLVIQKNRARTIGKF